MDSLKSLMPFAWLYVLGFLITAGHFYRRHGLHLGIRQAVCLVFWPVWGLLKYSVQDILEAISDAAMGTDDRAAISFGVGLFAAGQFLSSNWETCSSGAVCTGVLLKSSAMLFPPVGATYLTWLAWQFA